MAGHPGSAPPVPPGHTFPGHPGSDPAHSALWPSAAEPRSGTWAGGQEEINGLAVTEATQTKGKRFV